MKQWIREHPWYWEIVPAFIVAAVAVMSFMQTRNDNMGLRMPSEIRESWVQYSTGLLSLLCIWLVLLPIKHIVALHEREKKFDYFILFLNCITLGLGYLQICTFSSSESFNRIFIDWVIISVIAIVMTVVIELARPVISLEVPINHDSRANGIKAGDLFYYRNVSRDWLWVITTVPFTIWYLIVIHQSAAGIWLGASAVAFQIVIGTILRVSILKITKDRIAYRYMRSKMVVKMSNVTRCQVERVAEEENYGPSFSTWWITLWTKEGKALSLGTNNPEPACTLINTAIAGYAAAKE